MTPEQAEALLKPFPPETIGKLPRITCPACSKTQGRVCPEHRKIQCRDCSNWISERHIHLDYVGHAAVTKRLLDVDAEWSWEPVAFHPNGAPAAQDGGLWIRLTICGVTRYGWGDGPDPKQMISDAIRNAAMRFGVALDLWSKEDLRASDQSPEEGSTDHVADENKTTAPAAASREPSSRAADEQSSSGVPPTPGSPNRVQQLQAHLSAMISEGVKGVAAERTKRKLPKLTDECTAEELNAWADLLNEYDPKIGRGLEPVAEPVMTRKESKAKEAEKAESEPTHCPECGAGPLEPHAEGCSVAPF